MTTKINLLPNEFKTDKRVIKFGKVLKYFVVVSVVIFILLVSVGTFWTVRLSNESKELVDQEQELKTSITNLETTEQQLVFVRDRVDKIQTILSDRINEKLLAKQVGLESVLPENTKFDKSHIEVDTSDFDVVSTSSVEIRDLVNAMLGSDEYASLAINSLSFLPTLGYEISFEIF